MTPEERELRRLEEAATPGPWAWTTDTLYGGTNERGDEPVVLHTQFRYFSGHGSRDDRAFIAAARNALPKLLDALDAKDAEIERLRAALQQVVDTPRATSITTARSIARKALETP